MGNTENFGGKTDYYQVFDNCVDVDDYCSKYNINFFMGNILKAVIRIDKKDEGQNAIRDLNKIIHYANKEKNRRLNISL